jgi:S-adenosylmethionine:tRNA ribosyltransferase-isomerase
MRTEELDFDFPQELIAQTPTDSRSDSRLLHYRRGDKKIEHLRFSDLPGILNVGDLLVFNDAKVIPAKIALRKSTAGRIEGLFLSESTPGRWQVLLKDLGNAPEGTVLTFENAPELTAKIEKDLGDGEFLLSVTQAQGGSSQSALEILQRVGRMPLPPYIKRDKSADPRDAMDRERYQTVYARNPGAVAAPTAGLHFSPQILEQLDLRGVERASITLQVGMGTFKPIETATVEKHPMHGESYEIGARAAGALNRVKMENRRILAVGTTTTRVIESQPAHYPFQAVSGQTNLLIAPPYRWKHTRGLLTNFHLPRSTLIALVAALVGLDEQRRIYAEAIAKRYRFFSYGDAMFID